jgi:hypothetical protein
MKGEVGQVATIFNQPIALRSLLFLDHLPAHFLELTPRDLGILLQRSFEFFPFAGQPFLPTAAA